MIPTGTVGAYAAHCLKGYDVHSNRNSRNYIMISIPTGTVGAVLRSKSLNEIMIRLARLGFVVALVLSQNEGVMEYLFGIAE